MRRRIYNSKIMYYGTIIILLILAIFGTSLIKKYIGYAGTEISGEAGTVTGVIIEDKKSTSYWNGLYGLAFTEPDFGESQYVIVNPGEVTSGIFVFDCISPDESTQEIYASTNQSLILQNVQAGTFNMIDADYLNLTNNIVDSANNTFTENVSIMFGSTNITNIPAVYTYVSDSPDPNNKFFTGILNVSGQLVMVAKLWTTSTTSFKGSKVRFQMLLPVKNVTEIYYFFVDPNDNCPEGLGIGQVGDSIVEGYVLDKNTSIPISNATVSAGGISYVTDETGYFNMTVQGNRNYSLISIISGYITNITLITTSIGYTTYQNLTMEKFYGYENSNSTIFGYVMENSTNITLENVTISVDAFTTTSNSTGNYSLNVTVGMHRIVAVKQGYDNFVGNFTISAFENLSYIIKMIPASLVRVNENMSVLSNGTVQGTVRDNSTNQTLTDVIVTISGVSGLTNLTGFYNITTLEGNKTIVGTKDGYYPYISYVDIIAYNITTHNFKMNPVKVVLDNGNIRGTARTSSGVLLEDVTVSVTGQSNDTNSTGEYFMSGIQVGTHNLVGVKEGYDNYVAEVNITKDQTTEHNITMITVTETGLGAGAGAGAGPGMGPGKGTGTGALQQIQSLIKKPVRIIKHEVSVKRILKKLKVGNYITVPISISNYRENAIDLSFSIEGDVAQLIDLDKESLVIESDSEGDITITILGNVDPGIYEGNFTISGDINEKIPIQVLVYEKEKLPIEVLLVDLEMFDNVISVGNLLKFRVNMQNMLREEKYLVALKYSIKNLKNNNTISIIEDDSVVIQTTSSLLKNFLIPADIETGDYVLSVEARFLGLSVNQAALFKITQPIYMYALFGVFPLWVLMIGTIMLASLVFLFRLYKHKRKEKKRYVGELHLSDLPKPGPRSAYVGKIADTEKKAYFNLEQLTVHTLIAGASGSGKTIAAEDIVEEGLLKDVAVIVFDPTAHWTGFLRKCEERTMLSLYPKFGMKKKSARAFNGNIHQISNAREIIDLKGFMKSGEINIFVTNKLDIKETEIFVANTIRQIFKSNLPERKELKVILVYDGIHTLLPKFGGSGKVFVQIERAAREFRKWGVGLVLVSQVLSDFPDEVLANINTQIQLRTRDEGDLKRTKENYGEDTLKSIVKAGQGTGVVQNSSYNKGKPFFVSFRPILHDINRLSEDVLENYRKYNEKIDDIDYQIGILEKEGVDVFDLKLELKLAYDKVKEGSFNMAGIYLESLSPRIDKLWKKIEGYSRKKRKKLLSDEELEELEVIDEENEGVKVIEEPKETTEKQSISEPKKPEVSKEPEDENKEVEEEEKEVDGEKESKEVEEEEKEVEENKKELEHINGLVSKALQLIKEGDKEEAKTVYSEIQESYKNLSNDYKPTILNKTIAIRKLLSN